MAERRMFAKSIINSGRFLRMPPTSRLLYYDLGMAADDDGIVEAYSVMTQTKATEDDLKVLVAKGYVKVLNEDLVTLICDWKTNNSIRSDRYHKSLYKDLLVQFTDEEIENTGLPVDNQTTTKGKGNSKKDEETAEKSALPSPSEIADLFNSVCESYPKVRNLSENRKKDVKARLRTYGYETVRTVFEKAEASDFMKGKNDRNWSADFDWIIKDGNFVKILEGKYDNNKYNKSAYSSATQSNFDYREYEILIDDFNTPKG